MNRAYRVGFCEKCKKREFTPKKGLVCSLTREHANFANECPEFDEDWEEAEFLEKRKLISDREQEYNNTLGLSHYGVKSPILAGQIFIWGSITWIIVGINYFQRFFFFPIFFIAIGIWAISFGKKEERKKDQNQNNQKE